VRGLRYGLAAGGISALAFLAGQLVAWQHLVAAGFFVATNPANAFFYLITALHGLHIVGGVAGLGCVLANSWRRPGDADRLRLGVEMCAMYWHFLLLVWIVLFSILALGAWPEWFYAICFGP
jgi:cytochrome c oxidase subunit 3